LKASVLIVIMPEQEARPNRPGRRNGVQPKPFKGMLAEPPNLSGTIDRRSGLNVNQGPLDILIMSTILF
jgi:hypothetical protein